MSQVSGAVVLLLAMNGFARVGVAQAPATSVPAVSSPSAVVAPSVAQGGIVSGTVKSGVTPLPGVAVTATNSLTGKKYATTTDIGGAFSMAIPKNGRYVVRAELAAFASVTQEVLINAESLNGGKPAQAADFAMQLASRQAAEEAQTATVSGAITRGLQSLNVQRGALDTADASTGTGNAGAALPSAATGDAAGSDAVTVSGAVGQTNGLAGISEDDIRQRIQETMQQAQRQGGANGDVMNAVAGMLGGMMGGGPGGFGGGPGGGGFGGGGGRGGGGGFRNFSPGQPHGTVYYQGAYNGLNAIPYSLTGAPTPNLGGAQNNFGVTFSGSPSIPRLLKASSKQFVFLSVTGQRNITPENFYGTVPTLAERAGDFSGLTQTNGGATVPVQLYYPAGSPNAGQAVPDNNLTAAGLALSPAALKLLAFYPAPNIAGTGTQNYNYQTITNAGSNRDTASLRYVRNFGQNASNPFAAFGGGGRGNRGGGSSNAKPTLSQNINFNGSYSHSANDNRNIFLPFGGSSSSDSYGVTAGYTISYGRLRNNASLNWNRSHSISTNYFTNKSSDPLDATGVSIPKPVIGADPGIYHGLPSLSFTGFTGINTSTPSDRVNQTISFSDFVAWNHKKHNMRFGFDIRRVHADSIGGTNALGTLTFSGYATQCTPPTDGSGTDPCPTASGSGFADFLLGLPQQSKIQAGAFKTYLRANVFDWYAQDDWRALPSLTLNFGLRYEYFSPYVEKYNRLVNLDHNAGFTAIAAVQPHQKGSYSGDFPRSLVNPDRNLYSPRLGLAYRPSEKFLPALTRQMVVRGGYGLNFNTGQYATIANQLAFQPPFAITQTNIANSQGCGALTLADAYGCSTATVQNNFSANKDYRLGHVQVWNLDIQKTLPLQIVANIGYNGSKGGELDILRAPNRTAGGLLNADVAAFNYEDSLGSSRFNGLSINVRKRLQKGIAIQATYLYGHSIDNASSIGGSGSVVAQDPDNLNAEEGNSSFDIRHQVSGNWVFELPFGPNRALLAAGGFWSKALDGFSVSGNYAFQSGSFYTPNFVNTVQEIATGVSSSQRADRNFGVPIVGAKTFSSWFNPAAFTAPATGAYGNASRNSIEGPGVVSVNSSLSRTLQLGSTRSFEARLQANNVFNTIQYSGINTTLNSPTFGQVSSVASTRSLTFIARYRF